MYKDAFCKSCLSFRTLYISLFALLLLSSSLSAQTAATAALTGTVTDSTGAVIASATVTVTNSGNGLIRTATTGPDGVYKLTLLPPGTYSVKFEAAGFQSTGVSSVRLDVTETPVLNQALTVGVQTQEVTVQADTELIQTATSALGTVVTAQTVTDLPLSTRNYVNLIAMSAGASSDVNNATALGKGWTITSVNGASNTQNNYQMDGAPIDNWASFNVGNDSGEFASLPVPNPDAIQEFKIQTSSYDASYGRNAGANVNVITKTGTNNFHGEVFEFFRNTALNANEWFFKRNQSVQGLANKQPVLNQNQFGGTFGGPVKKDKLFFFTSYQETRQANGISLYGFAGVPLPPIPGGDRGSCAPVNWTNISTQCNAAAQSFIQNLGAKNCAATTLRGGLQVLCDGSDINPVAINLLQLKRANGNYYIPSPSLSGFPVAGKTSLSNFSDPAQYKEHQLVANGDYLINSKHTFGVRYMYSANPTTAPFSCAIVNGTVASCLPGAPIAFSYPDHSAVLRLTSLLSNNLVNEARVSYQRFVTDAHNLVPFTDSQVGITPLSPSVNQLSALNITNQFVMGANSIFGASVSENQIQGADQLSWTHGKHSVRTGAEFAHNQMRTYLPANQVGQPTFPTFVDFLIGRGACNFTGCSAANPGATNGTSFSSLSAIGNNLSVRAFNGQLDQTFKANELNAFIQDDFKISSRLTVNLGLRWEFNGFATAADGGWSDVWPSLIKNQPIPGNSPANATLVGYMVPANFQGPIPAGVFKSDNNFLERIPPSKKNFGPRAGFAWQPFETNRFVVRGGAGLFFDRPNGHLLALDGIVPAPYAITPALSPNDTLANPFILPATIPGPAGTPGWPGRWLDPVTFASSNLSGRGVAEDFKTATVYEWNLNTQTEFLHNWVLELGYVGSHGIHLGAFLPVAGVTAGGTAQPINLAQFASPAHPINCGYDGVAADCITTNTTQNIQARVPYLGFTTGMVPVSTVASYKFNSLQATVRKQLSHGLQFQAAYTWSRAFVDYWVGNPAANQAGIAPAINIYGPNSQYRPSRLVLNYGWALPFGTHSGFLGLVSNGWNWSGVVTIQSGTPLVITDGRDGSIFRNAGGPTGLATFAAGKGNSDIATSGSMFSRVVSGLNGGAGYMDRSVFMAPQSVGNGLGYGGAGLGALRGPSQNNWDMSLAKTTKVGGLREDATLEFRTEFFNTFNHPQFLNPAADASQGSFGSITATAVNPRLIQFALKYAF